MFSSFEKNAENNSLSAQLDAKIANRTAKMETNVCCSIVAETEENILTPQARLDMISFRTWINFQLIDKTRSKLDVFSSFRKAFYTEANARACT